MTNQFDKILEARFIEIFGVRVNENPLIPPGVIVASNSNGDLACGFYRVDEDLKITRISKRDVEIQPIVKE